MKTVSKQAITALVLGFGATAAWAYGGGGGSTGSCSEPVFSEESPAKNSVVPRLTEVFVVASENTQVKTLEFEVGKAKVRPEVTTRRSGEFELRVKLPAAIEQPGKVRIAVTAMSKDGCSGFFPYFVEVKP